MQLTYANQNHSTTIRNRNGVVYITFPILEDAGLKHGASTRIGGVSVGHLSSMNLSFTRGDRPENVTENFRRIGEAIGFRHEDLVMSSQIHGTRIRAVTAKDKGAGILRPTVQGIDALVTDEPGIPLGISYADCVPLIFYDPVRKVTGMAHAGWRGTVAGIGEKFVRFLAQRYGSDPADILAVIGPSICVKCYEVGPEVAKQFENVFPKEEACEILTAKENGKYQLDLWKANAKILQKAGIRPEHTDITDLCTCCNSDLLFSHRASHGMRGNLVCFVCL